MLILTQGKNCNVSLSLLPSPTAMAFTKPAFRFFPSVLREFTFCLSLKFYKHILTNRHAVLLLLFVVL